MKPFITWTYSGVVFLAANRGNDVHIINENGENFGSWLSLEGFRKKQQAKDSMAQPLNSGVRLLVEVTR